MKRLTSEQTTPRVDRKQEIGVVQPLDSAAQAAFSAALCGQLREARRRLGLTQAQLSARTGGLVSKAALANYETGHRSLRIDIFWVLARALGEDGGTLLSAAERAAGFHGDPDRPAPITVDVAGVAANIDPRLGPVRRWFDIRYPHNRPNTETLDDAAIRALSSLMDVTPAECRHLLLSVAGVPGMDTAMRRPATPASTPRRGGHGGAPSALGDPHGAAALSGLGHSGV